MSDTTTDIGELMARDPLELTDQDLDAIIARLREQRSQFNLGNAMAGKMKAKPVRKEIADLSAKLNIKDLLDGI